MNNRVLNNKLNTNFEHIGVGIFDKEQSVDQLEYNKKNLFCILLF